MRRRTFCKNAVAASVTVAFSGCDRGPFDSDVRASGQVHAVTGDGDEISIKSAAVAELAESLQGKLYLPADAAYDDVRKVWNGMVDKRPALIAQCTNADDVSKAVSFASNWRLLVSVRGGGHSYPGKSVCDKGMMIDLSRMQAVAIDAEKRTAKVAGGALLGHLDGAALEHELLTTTGIVSHTGVGGFTLGGGMGRTDRLHGLAVDNLLEATVVTPDGQALRANDFENPELFWAIRGGGGNFGVVTEFVFRLHPFDERVYGGSLYFSFDHARELLETYASLIDRLPNEANVEPGFIYDNGERYAYVTVCFSGDHKAAERICAPFATFAAPLDGAFGPASYREMQTRADAYYAHGTLNYLKSGLMLSLSPESIDAMIRNYEGEYLPDVWFQHLGGVSAEVPVSATAYAHRDAIANLGISATWSNTAESESRIAQVRRFHEALAPYMKGFYANLNEDAERETEANYGPNYPRLVEVKNKYDPGNLFRLNANIKPTT